MNRDLQVRDAIVEVDRTELARAITVHLSGLLMNANARPNSESGTELAYASWIEVTVDGESSGVEDHGFKIERVYTDLTGIELVVLSREVPLADEEDVEFVLVRCVGDSLDITVDQKIYTLPFEGKKFDGTHASDFVD